MIRFLGGCLLLSLFFLSAFCPDGFAAPLRVVLIPADGGTEDGTKKDFQPLFDTVSRQTGHTFILHVGSSYAAVVQALHHNQADLAFLGPVAFVQAFRKGDAELLAVAVEQGQPVYYAGLFTRRSVPVESLAQVKGRSVAFGDVNSTSSFVVPAAMLLNEGLRLDRDLARIVLAGSHAAALQALASGKVDVACASFESFERAVGSGILRAEEYRVLARSVPIPYPPLVMNPRLPEIDKQRLRAALASVHLRVPAGSLRGYGGRKVERYDVNIQSTDYARVAAFMEQITDDVITGVLRKAGDGR